MTRRFPGFSLGPLNLRIKDNDEILVLIGPTGSGKTTILNLISGLLKPDTGSILLNGLDITALPVESRRIGYTFQNPSLFPHMNVYENIVFGIPERIRGDIAHKEIRKLLEDLEISHLTARHIIELSAGEMQKISLARMLVTRPKIMLMDEPLAHLDVITKRNLRLELRHVLRRHKVPTIYVTHFEDDIYALADSVCLIENGFIKLTARLRSILSNRNNINNNIPSEFLSNIFSGQGNYLEGNVVTSNGCITSFRVGEHLVETLGNYPMGSKVGIIIRPEDIIISKEIVKTSARNVIKAKVVNITRHNNTAVLNIHLTIDEFHIMSRITEEAKTELQIKEGDYVYAIFKASSPQVIRKDYF